MLKPIILVRRTVDWGNVTVDKWLEDYNHKDSRSRKQIDLQDDLPKESIAKFMNNIKMWHRVFSITYPEYRQELKNIAMFNWERMGCDIVEMPNLKDDKELKDRFRGYLLLPTDDDDWFNPYLGDVLPRIMEKKDADILTWDSVKYVRLNNKEQIFSENKMKVGSNAYCFNSESASLLSLLNHDYVCHANKLPGTFSVWIRHRASYWRLQNFDLNVNPIQDSMFPSFLGWADQEINALRKLDNDCVANSKKIKMA